jgi:signal recognition particle subunit SRP54
VPITFIGSGERLDDLEPFHPERVVSRMLGMGDVLSLVEKAERAISHERATRLEQKIRRDDFTLEDFRDQLDAIKQMGPLEQLIQLVPGMSALPQGASGELHADRLTRVEAMINSMTPKERRNHQLISGSRRRRIARGSGTTVEDLNRLLKQFVEMRKMLKRVGGGGRRGKSKKARHGHPRFSATPI